LLLDPGWLKAKLEATANTQALVAGYQLYVDCLICRYCSIWILGWGSSRGDAHERSEVARLKATDRGVDDERDDALRLN
jgi:hypothetical protein